MLSYDFGEHLSRAQPQRLNKRLCIATLESTPQPTPRLTSMYNLDTRTANRTTCRQVHEVWLYHFGMPESTCRHYGRLERVRVV